MDFEQARERLTRWARRPWGLSTYPLSGRGEADVLLILARLGELEREQDAAKNLLAVMHRDGGHHTAAVGFVQSCKDAEQARHDLLTRADAAERVRDELLAAGRLGPADPWPPPGLAPFDADPRPPTAPARASPAEAAEAWEAWERVSEALRSRMSPEAWATWIRPCRGLYVREGRLQLEVPGAQHLAWIGQAWTVELHWAAAEAGLEGVDLVTAPPVAAGE